MQTGDVSTAEITDATPAVLASHMSNRACQGPADARSLCKQETKSAGGLGSIAEQEVDRGVDVILGGGRARFDQMLDNGSGTVTRYAQAEKGYTLVTEAASLAAAGPSAEPVLGLFNNGNISLEWNGPTAKLQDPATATTARPFAAPRTSARRTSRAWPT